MENNINREENILSPETLEHLENNKAKQPAHDTPGETTPPEKKISKADVLKDQLAGIFNRLADKLGSKETEATLKDYFKTLGKFHKFSSNNVLLMMDAAERKGLHLERVASFDNWKKFENKAGEKAHVNKGEKGLPIFVPVEITKYKKDEKGKLIYDSAGKKIPELNEDGVRIKKLAFKQGCVFDIKQTNAKEIGAVKNLEYRDKDKVIDEALVIDISGRILSEYDVKVNFKPVSIGSGNYAYMDDEINISNADDMTPANQLSTIFHELGHKVLHGDKLKNGEIEYTQEHNQKGYIEGEAEAFSYALSSMYGIDNNSALYLGSWSNKPEDLKKRIHSLSKAVKGTIKKLKLGEYAQKNTVKITREVTQDIPKQKGVGISV